jgi:hypothetical protein
MRFCARLLRVSEAHGITERTSEKKYCVCNCPGRNTIFFHSSWNIVFEIVIEFSAFKNDRICSVHEEVFAGMTFAMS